jgi:hypothetical protein
VNPTDVFRSDLAVLILSGSSAYAMAEVFGWQHGLDEKPRRAKTLLQRNRHFQIDRRGDHYLQERRQTGFSGAIASPE